ncbi:MAG TPA: hypothetical protein VKX17_03545 [Planctomycetota bacterium]|nr:hypothetical protein [Planctomycetota bacterium]
MLSRCAAVIVLAAFLFIHASAAEPELPPKSLDDQLKYLEGALAESLRTRDLAMLDMTVKGFKAAKLSPPELELFVLRAERNAAWSNAAPGYLQSTPVPCLEAWGQLARAKLGDDRALPALRQMSADLPPVPAPVPALGKIPAPEYVAAKKAVDDYASRAARRQYAILALALLNEPGIADKALAALPTKEDNGSQGVSTWLYGRDVSPEMLAVLAADPQNGLDRLAARLSDPKIAVKEQAYELYELYKLAFNSGGGAPSPDESFSAMSEIRRKLPKETPAKLIAAYTSILKRYSVDTKQSYDPVVQLLMTFGSGIPPKSMPPEGIAAVEEFAAKMPKESSARYRQMFDNLLRRQGKEPAPQPKPSTPVKPPKAPDER